MPALVERLRQAIAAERVSTRPGDLEAVARDESSLPAGKPEVVVWPASTEEVASVIRLAAENGTPVTARGAGSSLEGNSIPTQGGIVLDLSRMQRVLAVRADDLQVDVEPGVVYAELNRQLRPTGLFFPPSPGGSSDVATIGGMVATNASGIYSAKYGGTRDYVRAATAVTGNGEIVRLGNLCRKHSTGYHLLGLVIGSEGTLAILTEITLALAPLPVGSRRWAFAFADDVAAAATIADLFRYGVDVAAAEFLDRATIAAVNGFRSLSLEESPTLLIEAHGSEAALAETTRTVETIAKERSARPLLLAAGQDPWRDVRHYTTRAIEALDPAADIVRADLAVPISTLPRLVESCAAAGAEYGRRIFLFGHAGIGILHVLIPARREATRDWQAAESAKDRLVSAAIELGGTVSGEHGMGSGNRKYAATALGPALDLMKGVKVVFDPKGILNPGKIWE
jgi:D-lactate dehydrogenase (cytochrome)